MSADLGGSHSIEQALQAILWLPTIDGYLRQVFIITAGVVKQIGIAQRKIPLYLLNNLFNHTGFQQGWCDFIGSTAFWKSSRLCFWYILFKNKFVIQINQCHFQLELTKVWAATYPTAIL